jgi:carbon monoxide dehydrogenase subunit G
MVEMGALEANRNAPVFSEGRIEVHASPEQLWDLLADLEGWPTWNPDVASITVEGPIEEGTVFRWKTGPSTIRSTLRRVERPSVLGWTGRTFGIDAIHVWRFAPHGETTVAAMEESFEGLVARLFKRRLQKQLDGTTTTGLANLKAAAERGRTS